MGDGDFFPVILTIVSVFTIAELAMRRPWLWVCGVSYSFFFLFHFNFPSYFFRKFLSFLTLQVLKDYMFELHYLY